MARTGSSTTSRSKAASQAREIPWKPLAVLAAIVVAGVIIAAFDPDPPGVAFADLGNQHIPAPDAPHTPYNSTPPSSGPHLGSLAQWGVHEEPLPPQLFVHNLEDGGVVFTYDCAEACPELVEGLTAIVQDGPRRVLTAYDGIEHEGRSYRAAAVAWTKVYYFDELTDEVVSDIGTFVDLYEGLDHHVG